MSAEEKIMESDKEEMSSHDTPQAITIHIMAPSNLETTSIDSALVTSVEPQDATAGGESSSLLVVPASGDGAISVDGKNILQTVAEAPISEDLTVISNISSDHGNEQTIELGVKSVKRTIVEEIEEDIGCHCLICNEELEDDTVSVSVFKSFTTTSQRKTSIFLGIVVGQKLTSRKVHSTIICDKCFQLLNKLDLLELEIKTTKEEIVNKYQQTVSLYGGRARRKKPAAAKKSDYVFPKLDPDEDKDLEADEDDVYEPKLEDLIEEEHDQREDRDSVDEEWEPDVKRAKAKRELSNPDPAGPPKRKRGRPRKDASKSKEETALDKFDELEGKYDDKDVLNAESNESEKSLHSQSTSLTTRFGRRPRTKNSEARLYLDEPLCCAECGEYFNSEPLYRIHCTEAHGPLDGVKCPHCPLVFDKRHDLDSHMIDHNPVNHVCKVCNIGFLQKTFLIKHLKTNHPDTAHTCSRCNAIFVDEVQLHNHFVRKHKRGARKAKEPLEEVPENSVICSECGKVCPNLVSYQSHKYREHLHLFPFECEVCWRRFSKQSYLESHLKTHIEGTVKCSKCGVKFVNESHLVDHMYYVHGQKKVLMCDICKKFFSFPNTLKTHKEMEHRDLMDCNEICEVCSEKYPSKSSLKRHMLVHNRDYICVYCGRKRASKASLDLHINMIHTKEHSFSCPHCGKEFFAKHLMQMHVKRVHSDRTDYQHKCKLCNKAYLQEWELTLHHKTHTNERNYKCDVCGDAFYTLSRMRYHRATHKTMRDSECPMCPQMFRRDVDTKNHLRRVHKVLYPGIFMEMCHRYGKVKAKELHDGHITEKASKIKNLGNSEHITLYSVKEEQEPPLQVIIPDGVEMMVLQDSNCEVPDVPGLVDVYEVNQVDIDQVQMNQVDINQVEINQMNQVDINQVEINQMNQVDINQVEINQMDLSQIEMSQVNINQVKVNRSGEILNIIKIDDFGNS